MLFNIYKTINQKVIIELLLYCTQESVDLKIPDDLKNKCWSAIHLLCMCTLIPSYS